MFESIVNFFKRFGKNEKENSKEAAKERLHLVLAQDRANISADFLDMMKQEIIEVIKKYIDIDEEAIDVRMTNKPGEDGTVGAPALYANIPIVTIKNEARKLEGTTEKKKEAKQNTSEDKKTSNIASEEKEETVKIEATEESIEEENKTETSLGQENVKKEEMIEAEGQEENNKEKENHDNEPKKVKK